MFQTSPRLYSKSWEVLASRPAENLLREVRRMNQALIDLMWLINDELNQEKQTQLQAEQQESQELKQLLQKVN